MFDQMLLNYPQNPTENRWKQRVEIAPNCPRCASSNTKFCYYNNYSLSQPRYFCKGCRRYWTKGGFLRNVPIGGGCRKNRRRSRSVRSSAKSSLGYVNSPSYSADDESDSSPAPANIDLADVFAKFLNQSSDQPNHDQIGGDDDENSLSGDMMVSHVTTEEDDIEEFMARNTSLLELQEMLDEELPQDFEPCWIDGTATVSSFAWEQEFEQFVSSSNVVSGDWSSTSLDLPSVGKLLDQSF